MRDSPRASRRNGRSLPSLLFASSLSGVLVFGAAVEAQTPGLRERILAAEDARVTTAADMAPILQGLRSTDPKIVALAVRALGRFERPELVPRIVPLVTHPRADVRAEAANALGQALAAIPRPPERTAPLPPEAATVTKSLLARIRAEGDPYVTGALAETLGRLPFATAQAVAEAESAIASLLPLPEGAAQTPVVGEPLGRVVSLPALTGAVKGLETRARVYQKLAPVTPATVSRLRAAATFGSDPSDADLAFVRRVAWLTLRTIGAADLALVERGFDDPDPQVRRQAVLVLGTLDAGGDRARLLTRALRDSSFIVRYDAVRMYGRTLQASNCAPVIAAVDDANPHVRLAAIDALGEGCPKGPSPVAKLTTLADALPVATATRTGTLNASGGQKTTQNVEQNRQQHLNPERNQNRNQEQGPGTGNGEPGTLASAHALVALARTAREETTPRLAKFAEHPSWIVRMYAARAAAAMAAVARLERLANDPNDNVREAAIGGLVTLRRHDADAAYIAALARPDYQLVRTAAQALKESPNGDRAVPALLQAFARITAERRDTSRDARLAILERLRELGGRPHAPGLQACLADIDSAIARECAAILTVWTGVPHVAAPQRRTQASSGPEAARRLRITMQRGGSFEVRLFSDETPATIARVARLARQGYYNGLTFHRVVPNFVLQGGSPGANEYMGDGPFMRDELGQRSHIRGTLGISTRGRDTGDAQIFVNLVDNPRLDHNYTVFAEVTTGMDVVDAIFEGDVIERVEVVP